MKRLLALLFFFFCHPTFGQGLPNYCQSVSVTCWANQLGVPQGNTICLDATACTATLTYNGTNIVSSKPISSASASSAPNFTLTDSTAGDTVLSLKSSTWVALDSTAVGASAPAYGLRYNLASTRVEFEANSILAAYLDQNGNTTLTGQENLSGQLTMSGGSGGNNNRIRNTSGSVMVLQGGVADGATAVNIALDGANTLSNATAELLSVRNNTTEEVAIFPNGNLTWKANQYTDNSGTPGNTTISKITGRAAIAAGANTVTVTNTLVSATSIVIVQPETGGGACGALHSVPAGGSFAVNNVEGHTLTNTTAACKFSFIVFNN